jgi:hypothetical protein
MALAPVHAGAATITPDTPFDSTISNDCSLREAIGSLNTGGLLDDCVNTGAAFGTDDTVLLEAETNYHVSISGTNEDNNATGDLDPLVDMTIESTAPIPADRPTILGEVGDFDRILHIPSGNDLTLESVVLDNDMPVSAPNNRGGVIYHQGTGSDDLTLDATTVQGGLVNNTSGAAGGGIAAEGGSLVIRNGSVITGNTAGAAVSSAYRGGGVYIGGTGTDLTVTDSTISNNNAGRGFFGATVGFGGGVEVDSTGSSAITLTNATVTGNSAGGGQTGVTGSGGGIHLAPNLGPTLQVTGGTISQNHAGGAGINATGNGGGVMVEGTSQTHTFTGVEISDNEAGGDGANANGNGGGLHLSDAAVISESEISGNKAGAFAGATGSGGGLAMNASGTESLTVTESTIADNVAGVQSGAGGGFTIQTDGAVNVTDTLVVGNKAAGFGGGVSRTEAASAIHPTDTIIRSVIAENEAGTASLFGRAGGLNWLIDGSLAIQQSSIIGNSAHAALGTAGTAGGVELSAINPGIAIYEITNSTVSTNTAENLGATGGQGGGIRAGGFDDAPQSVLVSASTIANNSAPNGNGGNIYVDGPIDFFDLRGTIVSGGTGNAGVQNCAQDGPNEIDSLGGNVESTTPTQCGLGLASDRVGADPLLGPLADNGGGNAGSPLISGPRMSHALPAGSPALDLYSSGCPATDQIGTSRPQGSACDSGAFELLQAAGGPTPVQPAETGQRAAALKKCKKKPKKKRKKCRKRARRLPV